MIKKIITFFFALTMSVALVFAFSSCGESEKPSDTSTETGSQGTTPSPDDDKGTDDGNGGNCGTPDDGNGESPNPDDNQGGEKPDPDDVQSGQEPNPDDKQDGGEIPNPDDNQGDEQGGAAPHTHSYGEWITVIKPTCTEEGLEKQECSCGDYKTEPIEATGHSEEIVEAVEPNCTETGLTEGKKCSVCGVTTVEQETISAKGHSEETIIGKEATCTETGLTDGKKCTVCGITTVEQETISAKGHSEETIIGKEATCTETGLTDGKKCTVCQAVTEEQTIIPTKGHNYVNYACTICGLELKPSEGLSFKLDETTNTYIVTGIGTCKETNIVIPKTYEGLTVTKINDKAFYKCTSLTSITIPGSVTSIGSDAFYGCYKLVEVYISDITSWCNISFTGENSNPLYYANNLYINNELVTKLVIPNTVTKINYKAFCGGSFTSITIPGSVTSIGDEAFYKCTSLTSITIPDSVTSIGGWAFGGCTSLKEVHISDIASWCNISFSGFTSNPLYYANNLYINNELVTNLVIPDTVTKINYCAFCGGSFTSVTIGNGVTSIGRYAFEDCSSLTSITIPGSVTSIGDEAFSWCDSLKEVHISDIASWCNISFYDYDSNPLYYANNLYINNELVTNLVIPNTVTKINDYAFCGGSFTSITIPSSVTSIGSAFSGCSLLKEVYISDIASWCNISFSYQQSNPLYYANNLYINNELVTNLVIPDTVTKINYCAFCGGSFTSVTIGNGVTSIGSSAFRDCKSLTSITIGNNVTSIGYGALRGCSNLESITIPFIGYSRDAEAYEGVFGYIFGYTVTAEESIHQVQGSTSYVGTQVGNLSGAVWQYSCYNIYNHSYERYYLQSYYYYIPQTLKSVTITDGKINSYAFNNCTSLTSITIGSGVTSIGKYAFENCTSLKEVHISDIASWCNISFSSVTSNPLCYGANLYINNELVTNLVIPNTVTKINDYAFCGGSFTSITIPSSVTSIGEYAFAYCASLTSVTIGDSVTTIGYYAFRGCTSLKEVYISDIASWCKISFYDYDSNPLYYAKNLYINNELVTNLTIPDTVTKIYNYAFCGGSFTSVTIGNGVTLIGYRAFYGCDSLTSVTIGDSVTSIGNDAFDYCYKLVEVYNLSSLDASSYFDYEKVIHTSLEEKSILEYVNDYIFMTWEGKYYLMGYVGSEKELTLPESYNGNNYEIYQYTFYNRDDITKVTIPDSVTAIGNSAFYNCTSLTSVTIGNSVSSIGDEAFSWCDSLTSITIPNSVTSIGEDAFSSCTSLTSVTIGSGVTLIGSSAFSDCNSLTNVTIGNSVTSIGGSAFYCCYKLVEVYNLSSLNITKGSYNYGNVGYYAKVIHTSLEEESILEEVNDYIFMTWEGKYYLMGYIGNDKELTLPENYNGNNYEIYQYAFFNSNDITKITISNGVTSIGSDAFRDSTSLKNITIGDGVTSIGDRAFYSCTSLTSITIPDSVTSIGSRAFSYCTSLTSITIPDSVTSTGYGAFSNCTSLTSITIPDSVTSIENHAFSDCTSLTSITIPNSVTSIGTCAFDGCTSITSVTFENTSGWYVTTTQGATSGTRVDVTNATTNATNLTDTYNYYYWYRTVTE